MVTEGQLVHHTWAQAETTATLQAHDGQDTMQDMEDQDQVDQEDLCHQPLADQDTDTVANHRRINHIKQVHHIMDSRHHRDLPRIAWPVTERSHHRDSSH